MIVRDRVVARLLDRTQLLKYAKIVCGARLRCSISHFQLNGIDPHTQPFNANKYRQLTGGQKHGGTGTGYAISYNYFTLYIVKVLIMITVITLELRKLTMKYPRMLQFMIPLIYSVHHLGQ